MNERRSKVASHSSNMELTERHTAQEEEEEEEEEETSEDAPSCPLCHPITGMAVAMVTLLLLTTGLLFCLVIFVTAAPRVPRTSSAEELTERLEHCAAQRHRVDAMLREVTEDSRCRLCPGAWTWWRRHCYFFSVGLEEHLQWNRSQEFCRGHNSSLAVITDSDEMDFIQSVMSGFAKFPFLWVGLTDAQQEGQWLWADGTHSQHHMTLTVEWDTDHRDCADLRGSGRLFASDCDSYGPWVCKRKS